MLIASAICRLSAADYLPGWPYVFPYAPWHPVIVDDIIDGPEKELVIVSFAFQVLVLRHDGSVVPGWPVDLPTSGGSIRRVLVGDVLLSNPGPEIVVVRLGGRIFVLSPTGQMLADPFPEFPLALNYDAQLADLDGDGDLEIVQAISGGYIVAQLLARHGDGTIVEGFPLSLPDPGWMWTHHRITLADIDFDGSAEIVISPQVGPNNEPAPIYLFRGDGTPVTGFQPSIENYLCNTVGIVSVADLDGNYSAEIVGNGPHCLVGLNAQGNIHWATELVLGSGYTTPAIGNFDSDPNLEVAVGGLGAAYVFDPDSGMIIGETDPAYRQGLRPTAGDFNGDGIDELVIFFDVWNQTYHLSLHVLDVATMTNLPGWPVVFPVGPSSDLQQFGILEDLDADGDLEIICMYDTTVHVFDMPNAGAPVSRASWPTDHGNAAYNRDYHFGRAPQPKFIRGDANRDGLVDLADVISQIDALFHGAATSCPLALDIDDDGSRDIADLIGLVGYQFMGAQAPTPPFPECGAVPNTPECLLFECP